MKAQTSFNLRLASLLTVFTCSPVAAADVVKGICAYSISGAYGPISRYLYYAFLLIPMLLHDLDWLIGGTLGASMLFSSITTIHGIALAAVRGRGTVDLDIIPVFAITGVGMLAGTPMMIWSKTLREAPRSARAIVFLWIGLMFIGVLASVASLKAVPRPQPCDEGSLLDKSCGLTCNATLPMRNGQPVISIPYLWKDEFFNYSGWFAAYGSGFALMGIMYASSRQTPKQMAKQELKKRGMSKRLRQKNAGRVYGCAFCVPPIGLGLAVSQVVVTELVMLGPHHVPLGEGLDAVGQWSTLVGAFFAIFAAAMKWWIDKKELPPAPRMDWPARERDLEANYDSEAGIAKEHSKQINLPRGPEPIKGESRPDSQFNFGQVFKEGAWWGHGLDGTRIPHEGIVWTVQDGKLHRDDSSTT